MMKLYTLILFCTLASCKTTPDYKELFLKVHTAQTITVKNMVASYDSLLDQILETYNNHMIQLISKLYNLILESKKDGGNSLHLDDIKAGEKAVKGLKDKIGVFTAYIRSQIKAIKEGDYANYLKLGESLNE